MDRSIWKIVLRSIRRASRQLPQPGRRPKYPDTLIVAMFLWSVWHRRCLSWATQRSHYGGLFRPRQLPSTSQFTRRIKTARCQSILQRVHDDLAGSGRLSSLLCIDGKAMLVSPVSKDKDARRGRVSGGFAKGFKLHVIVTENGRIPLWSVTSLNVGEPLVAQQLIASLPVLGDDSLIIGDGNYDSKHLHTSSAGHNARLLTPPRGMAEHPVTLRQMGPARRESLKVWRESPSLAKLVLRRRLVVENVFSRICELSSLPAWVRGIRRVRRWVGGVLILYHARLASLRLSSASAA